MRGLMMDVPLSIASIIEHAATVFPDQEVVTRTVEGPIRRSTYGEIQTRAKRLANALRGLGITPGERIGTIAWNTHRHLEAYFAISGMGAVCHVINPRTPAEQLAYIMNHAEDRVALVDATFVPLIAALKEKLPSLRHIIVMNDEASQPEAAADWLNYEQLLDGADADLEWPKLDENAAAALCYTSGTTGNPKGVLYSHRSSVLHALTAALPDIFCCSEKSVILPVVPMFHAMAWGVPYAAPLGGAKLVMPGPALDGDSLFDLMEAENVTCAAGVPTIWLGLLATMRRRGRAPSGLERTLVGGAAISESMAAEFDEFGVTVRPGWGMTEMSPVGSICNLRPDMEHWPAERRYDKIARQGRQVFGVSLEIIGDKGEPLPHDGETRGHLTARGPWLASAYYASDVSPLDQRGWLDTGDIATIDEHAFMKIVDRGKDLIKSGGEWISSIDIENHTMSHPGIAHAAVIAIPDQRWGERPLLIAVAQSAPPPSLDDLHQHLSKHFAKWQLPEDVVFVETLPIGSTGKVLKSRLREQYHDYKPRS